MNLYYTYLYFFPSTVFVVISARKEQQDVAEREPIHPGCFLPVQDAQAPSQSGGQRKWRQDCHSKHG